ncbi:hypothetical protein [Novipirellula rosea]|uniref:Uncharacterized protein n=1 Tax=Novipirellula rosea TaxID=1031540 RepID=A0ABP8M9T5_9BACT
MNEYDGLEDADEFGNSLEKLCHKINGTDNFTCEVAETDPNLLLVDGDFTGLPEGHYLSILRSGNKLQFFAEKLEGKVGDELLRQIFLGEGTIDKPISLGTFEILDQKGVHKALALLGIHVTCELE